MKSLLTSLIILSAFLLAVTAQFPTLSPGYSLQSIVARAEGGAVILTGNYSVSVDITRGLQFVNETVTTTSGLISNNIRLSSVSDGATYLSVNGFCSNVAFNPNVIFPLNTNVWDLYAAGIESPTGTYTFTQNGITYQVTIINGTPFSFTFSFGITVITINVDSFSNQNPDFSTFCLPSECSKFECDACFSGVAAITSSVLLVLSALFVYFMTAV